MISCGGSSRSGGKDQEPVTEKALRRILAAAAAAHSHAATEETEEVNTGGGGGGCDVVLCSGCTNLLSLCFGYVPNGLGRPQDEEVMKLSSVQYPPGEVISYTRYESLDIHELEFGNGLKVTYKPTHFQGPSAVILQLLLINMSHQFIGRVVH